MKSVLIKLRKGKTSFDWDEYIDSSTEAIEIISASLEEIPNRFNETSNLKSLTIVCPELKSLPESVLTLTKLETLKIKNSKDCDLLLDSIGHLPNVKNLQLANLKITKTPLWLEDATELTTVDIHGNSLKDLPLYFRNFEKLRRLNLDSNEFEKLPAILESINSINHLSLEGNSFDPQEKERIRKVFNYSF